MTASPPAGYSGTPLPRKLGVREGDLVLFDRAPAGFALDLPGVRVVRRVPRVALDVTLTFHLRRAELASRLPTLLEHTGRDGMVWVCWPKKAAQRTQGIVSDLDDGVVRELGLDLGWVDVKVAAIDETWSGLKFVRRLADR